MSCDCIKHVNALLKDRNTALVQPLILSDSPCALLVETYQIETGRGKPKKVSMFASFCPFCGIRYEKEEAAP